MSSKSTYRCKDCGFVWRDTSVEEGELNPFIKYIQYNKTLKKKSR
jgi:rubredoxin